MRKLLDLEQGKDGHFDHVFIQPGTGSHRAIKKEKKKNKGHLCTTIKINPETENRVQNEY